MRQSEEKDLIKPKIYSEIPPCVEYSLTETGKSLSTIPDAMSQVGKQI